jgi:hypothetical protein
VARAAAGRVLVLPHGRPRRQEGAARPLGGGRYALPDGSERFLVDAAGLERLTDALGGELLDPVKTTVVHGRRSMTTWVVRRLR